MFVYTRCMSVIKKYLYLALISFFLFGCASTDIHDTGEQEEHQETTADDDASSLSETEDESGVWITLRRAPLKEEGGRYAYLTFDDGPSQNTRRILEILSDFQVKGTFFFVGDRIAELGNTHAADILRRVLADGHFIGMHSMTHDMQHLYRVPGAHRNFYNEMRTLQSLIKRLTGGFETNLYRPPYGSRGMFTADHIRTMRESDLRSWDWNIDSLDWKLTTVDGVMNSIKNEMKNKDDPHNAVILLHERTVTVRALPSIIEYYRDLGYTFLPYHPGNHFVMSRINNPDL